MQTTPDPSVGYGSLTKANEGSVALGDIRDRPWRVRVCIIPFTNRIKLGSRVPMGTAGPARLGAPQLWGVWRDSDDLAADLDAFANGPLSLPWTGA
jgi:hypothetical protein